MPDEHYPMNSGSDASRHDKKARNIVGDDIRKNDKSADLILPTHIIADNSTSESYRQLSDLDHRYSAFPAKLCEVEQDHILAGDTPIQLDPAGWATLASCCGSTSSYWSKFPDDFRAEIVRRHFENGDHLRGSGDWQMVTYDGVFRGFRRADLVQLNARQVFDATLDGLGDNARELEVDITPSRTGVLIDLTTPRVARDARRDDPVHGGVSISHSYMGEYSTSVELYIKRLLCSNGMVYRQCLAKAKIKRTRRPNASESGVREALGQVCKMTQDRWAGVNDLLSNFADLSAQTISRGGEATADAMQHFLMPHLDRSHLFGVKFWENHLLPAWEHDMGGARELSEYGAVNTLTYLSSHSNDLSIRKRRILSHLAGLIAQQRVHVCKSCRQAVFSG